MAMTARSWRPNATRSRSSSTGKPCSPALSSSASAGLPELLDYLTQDNIRNAIPNRPRPAVLAPDFLADVRAALVGLPAQVKRLLSTKLAGIRFAEDIGGTGYAEEIVDADRIRLRVSSCSIP